jgi:hypothetical protein
LWGIADINQVSVLFILGRYRNLRFLKKPNPSRGGGGKHRVPKLRDSRAAEGYIFGKHGFFYPLACPVESVAEKETVVLKRVREFMPDMSHTLKNRFIMPGCTENLLLKRTEYGHT